MKREVLLSWGVLNEKEPKSVTVGVHGPAAFFPPSCGCWGWAHHGHTSLEEV